MPGKNYMPVACDPSRYFADIGHHLLGVRTRDVRDGLTAGISSDRHHVVVSLKSQVRGQRLPSEGGKDIVVLRQDHPEGTAQGALVSFVQDEAGYISHIQAIKAPDTGVGAYSIAQHPLRRVEPKLLDYGPIQNHSTFHSGRI